MIFNKKQSKNNLDINLSYVSAKIHDKWFNVSEVAFDQSAKLVEIPLRSQKSSDPDQVLAFQSVQNVEILDTELVESYDINRLTYDYKHQCVKIIGNIRIEIQVYMNDCALIEVVSLKP